MKKKVLAASVCAAMVLSLTACAKSEEPVSGISSQTESSDTSKPEESSSTPEQNSSEANGNSSAPQSSSSKPQSSSSAPQSSSSAPQSSSSAPQSSSSAPQSSSSAPQSSSSAPQSSSSAPQSSSSAPQSSSSKPQSSSSKPQSSSSKPQSSSFKPQSSSSTPQSSSSKPQSSSSTTSTPTPTTNAVDWSKIPYADELDFTYENCDGGVRITGYTGSETVLKIPETINGKPVVRIGNRASGFRACTDIKVPSKVTVLEERCFASSQIKSVDLPNGLKEIEADAMKDSKIQRVTIPDTVTHVGYLTVDWSMYLDEWIIYNAEVVYKGKTYDASHLAAFHDTVNIDASGMVIQDGVLKRVSRAKTTIVVPSDVKEIDATAFTGCSDLTSVTIPEGVTSIWIHKSGYTPRGFEGCNKLKSLTLPNSLTYLQLNALGSEYFNGIETITWKGRTYKRSQFERLCNDVSNQ